MRVALVLLVLALNGPSPATGEPPRTLRVDLYHSGNRDAELYSLDRVVLEPLPFPGNPASPVDRTRRGAYLFEVRAAETGEVLHARSYSSIFGEWRTTPEARELTRTFHESLRFPSPSEPVDVVILERNADHGFDERWRLRVDPRDDLVHRESGAYAGEVVAILENGDPAAKVDLLLLGDGYAADERDEFLAQARALTDVLFATEPFRKRRGDFNVWALAPASRESGISRPSRGLYRDTPFGARYDAFRSERYILSFDNRNLRRIVSSAAYDFIEILTNSETYGGGGIYGLYGTVAAKSEWAGYLFVHEFGHHFAGLADEYYTSSVAYEPPDELREPYEPNVTASADPARVKWRRLITPGTPLPTPWPKAAFEKHALAYQARRAELRAENAPEAALNRLFRDNQAFVEGLFSAVPYRDAVGAFEGANYQAAGYYRPELNCVMFTRSEAFCRVCRAAIEAIIDEYTRAPPRDSAPRPQRH